MMRKIMIGLTLGLVLLVMAAMPALAEDLPGNSDFGQHVAAMAQAGHLGPDCNPGHHQGFSGWDEHYPCPTP